MAEAKQLKPGDAVTTKKYGKGVVLSRETVEQPSDDDHTFYVVKCGNGSVRHLKAADLA